MEISKQKQLIVLRNVLKICRSALLLQLKICVFKGVLNVEAMREHF
jgi:hypothetical protein